MSVINVRLQASWVTFANKLSVLPCRSQFKGKIEQSVPKTREVNLCGLHLISCRVTPFEATFLLDTETNVFI